MCLLGLDLSSLTGALHATNSWQKREFSSTPVLNFMQAAPAHCLWICPHRSHWGIQAGIRLFPIPVFHCVWSEMVHLCSWNRLLAYWGNTVLPGSLEIPERNYDASMYFLNIFLWIVFPNVKFRYQYLAGQCTVSVSSLSMPCNPYGRSRQAKLLQGRASFGVIIMQKSSKGREDTAASISVLVCLGLPAGWSSQTKAALIPSCCSVPHTASIFSQESFVNYG